MTFYLYHTASSKHILHTDIDVLTLSLTDYTAFKNSQETRAVADIVNSHLLKKLNINYVLIWYY